MEEDLFEEAIEKLEEVTNKATEQSETAIELLVKAINKLTETNSDALRKIALTKSVPQSVAAAVDFNPIVKMLNEVITHLNKEIDRQKEDKFEFLKIISTLQKNNYTSNLEDIKKAILSRNTDWDFDIEKGMDGKISKIRATQLK